MQKPEKRKVFLYRYHWEKDRERRWFGEGARGEGRGIMREMKEGLEVKKMGERNTIK